MLDRFKQIPARLLEIWKKYTKKQKTTIISIAATVILMLIILIVVLGRTQYVYLQTFKDIGIAKNATEALKSAGIAYEIENDNLTVNVDSNKYTDALYMLSTDEFAKNTGFSRDDLLKNDMSTTNADKKVKANLYTKSDIEENLRRIDGIDDATVSYRVDTDKSSTFLEPDKEIICSVNLMVNNRFKASMAETIAVFVASALGNPTTNSITIMDQYANLLFNGGEEKSAFYGSKRSEYEAEVKKLFYDFGKQLGISNGFQEVTLGFNLKFDYGEESEIFVEYLAAEGSDQPLLAATQKVSSETQGGASAPVGTDSNDEELTGYLVQTTGSGSSSYESEEVTYHVPSQKTTTIVKSIGDTILSDSSLAVTLNKNIYVTERDLTISGALSNTTLEEYIYNNRAPVQIDVPDIIYEAYSDCTGIPRENITIIAYETTVVMPAETTPTNWDLILKIVLAALIIGMLVFVVFRGMAPVEVTELEPELSVEQLLATTKENQSLEDIEFGGLSETRKLIEKFVDENPEAVANLLRGWLDDDWD